MTKVVIKQNYILSKIASDEIFVSFSINDVNDNVNVINSESYWLKKEK